MRRSRGIRTCRSRSCAIGYVKTEFEAQPQGRGRGEAAAAGRGSRRPRRRGGRGRGRGGLTPEQQRAQAEARLKILNDALDVFRKAGATLQPVEIPGTQLANTIGFILSVEAAAAFDDLTRSNDISDPSLNTWPNTFRTHRYVPAVEYIRAQRARTLLIREMDTLMSQYDVFLSLDQQRQPGPDQPDRPPGAGAARRIHREDAGRVHDHRPALRRGHGAAGRARARARDRVASQDAGDVGTCSVPRAACARAFRATWLRATCYVAPCPLNLVVGHICFTPAARLHVSMSHRST